MTHWDDICQTDAERKMLSRLRKTKLGQDIEQDYAGRGSEGYWQDDDDFTEIIERVGYIIGLWYEALECEHYYMDGLTPANIKTAERWVRDAEKVAGIPKGRYF